MLEQPALPNTILKLGDLRRINTLYESKSLNKVQSAFVWPTTGYIGWIYNQGGHNGVDIWTSTNCNENSTSQGNPVYAAASGTLDYRYKIPGGVYDGVRIDYGTVNGVHIWSHYWHLGSLNPQTGEQTSFVVGSVGNVDAQTVVGYQGNLMRDGNEGGIQTTCVHLHVTIANGSADSDDIDPSPYFGENLNWNDSNHVEWHHYVEHPSGGTCSAPSLNSPNDGYVSPDHTINFDWSSPSDCAPDGYTFRVKTVPDMESGGSIVTDDNGQEIDIGIGDTSKEVTINDIWNNTDLYWSVRACKPCDPYTPGPWAPARRFRIDTSSPPPSSGGWHATYYDGHDRWWDTNGGSEVCDETIDGPELHKDWGSGAPCGMDGDEWVGDFEATINFPADEYAFRLNHDDGAMLWLNGGKENKASSSESDYYLCDGSGGFYLNGDEDLRVLLREDGGDAHINLSWTTDTSVCIEPPDPPNLQAPGDSATFQEGDSITLSWSDTGDEYYGEVTGGPDAQTFGWQSGTSKNLGALAAGTYSWRIKARNSEGESGWSAQWTFTVEELEEARIVYDSYIIDDDNIGDSAGNNDGVVNCGETIDLSIGVRNAGDNAATDVKVQLEEYESFVTLHNPGVTHSYGDIPGGETQTGSGFVFDVAPNAPDGESVSFNLTTMWNGIELSMYNPFEIPITCVNSPPDEPSSPSPGDGASSQGVNANLSWAASSDFNGDSVTYDVYFGTNSSPSLVSSDQTDTTYDPGTLNYDTHYYWKIVAEDEHGATATGPVWDFTTETEPVVGPLVYDNHTVDDDTDRQSNGNNDGVVNCGETVELYADLYNEGNTTATGVNATISTWDPYITFTYNTISAYPDISGGGIGTNSDDFDFEVAPDVPDGHTIQFDLDITADNGGPWFNAFDVVVACPKPDLTPSQWGDWQYPVVPSSITDTKVVNTLYAEYATYIDWGLSNQGDANTGGTTYGVLYLDDVQIGYYDFGDVSAGQTWAFFDWVQTVDKPGWHTLRFVADPDDLIDESDETNNTFERDFYWTPVAPYVDDMENGTNDWSATGLWHQVDDSSPYPESHSGAHSWWYGQDITGTYDTGATNYGTLTSQPIYIPDGEQQYLRFWYWYETETQSAAWDQRKVQISVDDGAFSDILQLYDDPMNYWLQSPAIDLSSYAGHTIQVRFYFNTFDSQYNGYRGWYIDDFEISDTPPPTCDDIHEPNDSPAEATSIAYGQSIDADICAGGDYDFYQFTGDQGDKIAVDIDAMSEGSSLDPYAYLLRDDGSTVLAQNDDEITAEVRDSLLGYQLPYTGTYYIKVKAWDHPSVGSSDHFYTLKLLTDDANPASAEVTTPSTDSWLDHEAVTVTVSAVDDESGVNRVEFLWHDADWGNSDWVWLGADYDGRDGWTLPFDTSSEIEQRGGAVYVWAFDWLGNWTGAASWNLGIDRTPPTVIPDAYPSYGGAPFRDFWVNWWNSYDNQSGIASYDVQYQDSTAGAWTDLAISTTQVYTLFVGQDDHTYYFRARARDHAGNLSTYSTEEVSHTVDICDTAADAYETDGAIGSASWITPDGYSQIHNIHTEEDTDWVKFEAQAGITYTLTTGNTGDHADTVLELYDTDGSTLLAENDDCPGRWPASCLDWQAPSDGTYYAKIYHWDEYAYGCTTEYGLSIVSNREPSLALGEPGTSFRYTETMGVTEQAYVPDTQHLNAPNGLFIDGSDNLYVVEELGARLLKYRTSDGANLLSVGTAGLQNRGQYTFDHPQDVVVDSDGNIWTVDRHRVAQYDASGNFLQEFPPDDPWNAGDDNAHFDTPRGITFDSSGRMYVADSDNHRIQVYTFDLDGTPVYSTTIGVTDGPGDDNAHFDRPAQIVIDSSNRLYVTDSNNYRVQRCSYAGGWTCTTVHGAGSAGDGPGELDWTYGLGIDASNDHVYVVDSGNGRVKECYDGMFGWSCSTFATGLNWPSDVSVDLAGNVYVGDWLAHTIHKYDSSGSSLGIFLGTEGVPYLTDDEHFNAPHGVAVDGDGNIFLTEYAGYRLIKLNADGTPQWSVGEGGVYGSDDTHFGGLWDGPAGVAVDSSGNTYVADPDNHRVQKCTSNGSCSTFAGVTGEPGSDDDHLEDPFDVAVDADGNVYVADQDNHRVQKCTSASACTTFAGVTDIAAGDNTHFSGPMGVAVDTHGYVYVADAWNNRVQKCAPDGSCTTFAGVTGEWGEDFGHFWDPRDVAVDDYGRVYVADIYHQRVQVFDSDGAYLTTIGDQWGSKTGELRHAAGVAVDDQGNLYVADELNARVQKFALGVPGWQQVNINGFGDKDNVAGGIALHTFGDYLYAGFWRSSGGQLWRTSDETSWAQVTGDGFGNADNTSVEPGTTFDGYLYAGTWNEASGCEVHRSADGLSWEPVETGGFDDVDNAGVDTTVVFSDHLYAGTYNESTGAELWRTPDGATWFQVNEDGFGDVDNVRVWSMAVFDGALYVGTQNFDTGAEIWRSVDGTTWEQVGQDVFGDSHNQWPNLAVYDGDLYVGFANDSTDTYAGLGTQIWRSADGATWEHIVDDGFGDTTNGGSDTLVAFGPYLYAGTYNREGGTQLWRTSGGAAWTKAAPDGFGDSNNYSTYGSAVFGDRLFLAAANDAHGTEVWRTDLQLAQTDFDASPTQGPSPLLVDFTNLSTGDYDTCTWEFGDGDTSGDCDDPSHEYTPEPGTLRFPIDGVYTVTLTVSGLGGTDAVTHTRYITTYEAAQADFSASPVTGTTPLTVAFSDKSTGAYDTCIWDFGDGGTSNNCDDPNYTYESGGSYTVTLTVRGLGGSNTITHTNYVTAYETVQADFSAVPTSGSVPLTVEFTNLSTGDYDTCTWDFGDGESDIRCSDISHTYEQTGAHSVKLTVAGSGGIDMERKVDYITVTEGYDVFLPLVIRREP